MILIATALYPEALPFIKYYELKKDPSFTNFQVFRKEDIILVITKTGAINAAIAISSLCSLTPFNTVDLFLNIGVCAALDKRIPLGALYTCNKITQMETGRTFYPDMLYRHPFLEGSILTSPVLITDYKPLADYNHLTDYKDFTNCKNPAHETSALLIDMEAAGCFQGASYFFKPHQMQFLKIVSDHPGDTTLTAEKVTQLIEDTSPVIIKWIDTIREESREAEPFFLEEEEDLIKLLADNLRLSESMKGQLLQLCRYYKLKGKKAKETALSYNETKLSEESLILLIKDFLKDKPLPCQTKQKGKIFFEEFKQRIIP